MQMQHGKQNNHKKLVQIYVGLNIKKLGTCVIRRRNIPYL